MIDIFIAYSHTDLPYKDELKKFLRPLLREGRISLWDDFDIEAGQDWDARIKERLYGAGIVLLLVSSDSLASDYFYGKEVAVSLERHAKGETIVVPVILRHCDWIETPLGELEALPEKGRPVVEWPTRDQAFQDVVSKLRRVVESIEQKRKNEASQAEALRRFHAACEAADHLFEKRNWAEARAAYASALGAFLPGFVPDRAKLEARQAECDKAIRAEKEVEAQRQRVEKEAESQRQRAEKEQLLQAERERQKTAKRETVPEVKNPGSRKILWLGIGVIVMISLLILYKLGEMHPREDQNKKKDQVVTPAGNPMQEALDKAEAAQTIPALEGFKKQYPDNPFDERVKKDIANLQKKRADALISANVYMAEKEWVKARDKLHIALSITPNDADILKKLEKIKGK